MVDFDKYSDQPIFGAYSYGFTLYNDIKPVILTNDEQIAVVDKIPDGFVFIDTSTDNGEYIRSYLDNNMFKESRYTGIQKEEMLREWSVDGKKIKFALYGIELKSNLDLQNNIKQIKDNVERTELLCQVAAEKYSIDTKYEKISSGMNLDEKYNLMIDYNNDLDELYRKYNLTQTDIEHIADRDYDEDSINYIFGGTKTPLYGNVYGNIKGNVEYPIFGNVYGSIYGDVNATVYGDVYGNVYGNVKGNVQGDVKDLPAFR